MPELSPSTEFSTLDSVSRHAGRGNAVPCRNVALVPADRTEPSCKDVFPRPHGRGRQKIKEVFEQISWGRSADARKAIVHTSRTWLDAPHRTRQVRTDLNGRAARFVTEWCSPGISRSNDDQLTDGNAYYSTQFSTFAHNRVRSDAMGAANFRHHLHGDDRKSAIWMDSLR